MVAHCKLDPDFEPARNGGVIVAAERLSVPPKQVLLEARSSAGMDYLLACRLAMDTLINPTAYSVLWMPRLPSLVTNSQL